VSKSYFSIAVVLVGLLSSTASPAQPKAAVPPSPTESNSRGKGNDPRVDQLVQAHGVPAAEAAERVAALAEVQQIVEQALGDDPDGFGGVWVDHVPTFKIVIAFTGAGDRKAFLDRLPAKSRRHVQIRNAAKPLAAAQKDVDQILQALSGAKIAFETYFEPRSQNYVVTVKDQSAAGTARGLIPAALRSAVNVRVGPVTETFQTNVRSGDQVYGAWDLLDSGGQPTCTYGFAGRDSSGRDSILTAGHCRTNPPFVIGASSDGNHLVQLPTATATEMRYGDLYDFRYHPVVGLMTGYWVYFKNSKPVVGYTQYVNTVAGVGPGDYFTVKGTVKQTSYNSNHYVDMPVCKSGYTTGFTCGKVVANWVSGTDSKGVSYRGFVKVSGSSQPVIAFGGDSGGPVFSPPDSAYDIVALGLLKGGGTNSTGGPCVGSSCFYSYMPIDRVNDAFPFQIHTTQGLMMP
jgi:hypothetical protein